MAMTIVEAAPGITGGVDTHLDTHVAAALDPLGRLVGTESFDADAAGYKALFTWLEGFGEVTKIGIEGTSGHAGESPDDVFPVDPEEARAQGLDSRNGGGLGRPSSASALVPHGAPHCRCVAFGDTLTNAELGNDYLDQGRGNTTRVMGWCHPGA